MLGALIWVEMNQDAANPLCCMLRALSRGDLRADLLTLPATTWFWACFCTARHSDTILLQPKLRSLPRVAGKTLRPPSHLTSVAYTHTYLFDHSNINKPRPSCIAPVLSNVITCLWQAASASSSHHEHSTPYLSWASADTSPQTESDGLSGHARTRCRLASRLWVCYTFQPLDDHAKGRAECRLLEGWTTLRAPA